MVRLRKTQKIAGTDQVIYFKFYYLSNIIYNHLSFFHTAFALKS